MPARTALRVLALTCVLAVPAARAAELPSGAGARLERLARLWGEVRFRHPWVFTRGLDWDTPLLEAIPRVLDAKTPEAEQAALSGMLAALGDPATYLLPAETAPRPAEKGTLRWEPGEVLVLRLGVQDGAATPRAVADLAPELSKAKAVVVDLRGQRMAWLQPDAGDTLSALLEARFGQEPSPQLRSVLHSGYRPQRGYTTGGYSSRLLVEPAEFPRASAGGPRWVFLVDRSSPLVAGAVALQQAGRASIVAEGEASDFYFTGRPVDLGGGLQAMVRFAEVDPPLRADVIVPAGGSGPGDAAVAAAVALAAGPSTTAAQARSAPEVVKGWTPDRDWPEAQPPFLALRLLGLVRLWNVIRFFDPYLALPDEPWEGMLARHAPEFAAAETAEAWEDAVAALAARLQDTHVRVVGPGTRARFEGRVPATVRVVEGKPVVVAVRPAASEAGLRVGDVVERVDGAPVMERASALRRLIAASTAAGLESLSVQRALAGPVASKARLEVSGAKGGRRTVEVARVGPGSAEPEPSGLPWRILDGKVGLVDLTRLLPAQVDPMLRDLADAEAIVFDLRGYPRGVAWQLAPHLHTRPGDVAAQFRRRLVDRDTTEGFLAFAQRLGPAAEPVFRGPTVMLVDERTISQAEHTGLFLEQANGTVFVGTPTAGANGDVTYLVLPGGLVVSFTGHDVRHADGRQLQRIGLQPTVRVAPTMRGIRAGRDEVLEVALRYLKTVRRR